jgi:FkbM family methyltransferase
MQTSQLHVLHFNDWNNSHISEILQEIYLQKIYSQFLIGKKDSLCLDIGCNIGLWSLYASPLVKTVFSFEPASDICKIAQKNLDENQITNVSLFQKAIAPEDGKTTLYHSTNKTMYSLNERINDNRESEEVETIRLDTFVKENKIDHIDFMKLDIEGTEDKLFTSESFKNIVPILDSFIYEWHSWSNANPNIINSGLRDMGFTIRQIPSNATIFSAQK